MKLISVTKTRSGIVSASGVAGAAGAIKIDGLYKDPEDGLFYDKDDNNVQLKEGQIIYNEDGIYVVDDNDIHLLSTPLLIETTYGELVKARDSGKLLPGCKYRITDYQCTTAQEDTKSAGHQFDIVLLALSGDTLAEEGWAMMHDTPIYNVTFGDGITKKCYVIFKEVDEGEGVFTQAWIVDVETKLGCRSTASNFTINENDTSC